jgi:hypothetical protein
MPIALRQRFRGLQILARFGFGWKIGHVQEASRLADQGLDTGTRSFSLRPQSILAAMLPQHPRQIFFSFASSFAFSTASASTTDP